MASSGLTLDRRAEDLLAELPVSRTKEYGKGQMIYGPVNPSNHIYLVIAGKVSISRTAGDGRQVLLEILRPDEIFGESSFLEDVASRSERAVALETCKVMSWPVSDMEDLISKRPRLAVALLQVFAQRNADSAHLIVSFSADSIEHRLARSLLHFAERLGTAESDGSERMMPFTHLLLAQYVGTSREIITQYMNRFRDRGYISYSRRGIQLYRDSLLGVLGTNERSTTSSSSVSG